jgi:hypothetical protein
MAALRSFVSVYSPLVTMGLAILGLFAMATCIGMSLRVL